MNEQSLEGEKKSEADALLGSRQSEQPFMSVVPKRDESPSPVATPSQAAERVARGLIGSHTPIEPIVAEASIYRVHKERDRAVTAIPEILWRSAVRKKEELNEPPKKNSTQNVSEDALNLQLLELYALSQEYALEPATLKAAKHSAEVGALASLPDGSDDDFFDSLKEVLTEPTTEGVGEETSADDEEALKEANSARKASLRSRILTLMEDPALRKRYVSERAHEREIRHTVL